MNYSVRFFDIATWRYMWSNIFKELKKKIMLFLGGDDNKIIIYVKNNDFP